MSYEESAQEKLEQLLAQYTAALLKRQQQTLRGQVNYVDQSPLNELHPLQGTPINPVQRYAPTQPQPLTPPPSQLGLNSIHHMEEARRRAQELSQYQQAPDFQVNPASQKRMFDPYGFVPPQIAEKQNHAEGFDPLAERKVRIAEQGKKAQRNYDESLQRRKHLTYPTLSEQNWAEIKKEFNQMPIKTYKHLQEKDRVREVLTAMKTNQPIDWTVDPDTSELLHNWYEKYKLQSVTPKKIDDPIIAAVTEILGKEPYRHKEGYIYIGNRAVGSAYAEEFAKAFQQYKNTHGGAEPPLDFPTDPKRVTQAHDVTAIINPFLITASNKVTGWVNTEGKINTEANRGIYKRFLNVFDNNAVWDMQSIPYLPGQAMLFDPKTNNPIFEDWTKMQVKSQDQWCLFRGKVTRAGYISNFVFGYLAAAGRLFMEQTDLKDNGFKPMNELGNILWAKSIKDGHQDNPEDFQAIIDGYEAYFQEHPDVPKPKHPFYHVKR